MNLITHGGGVCSIAGFLAPAECATLIVDSEKDGYAMATLSSDSGDVIDDSYRNNGRLIRDDPMLAAWLYERALAHLPADLNGWKVCGFNERMRFYRYGPGQEFKWHKD